MRYSEILLNYAEAKAELGTFTDEAIDYETLLAERKASLVSLYPAEEQADVAAALSLESEPMLIQLQESTYREIVLRQRVNDAARAVMLAYALSKDLEHLAAFFDIQRLTLVAADPQKNLDAVFEKDTDLRKRTQLATQSYSVASPEGAYVSHALNAHGLVLDVAATSPAPCEVLVTVLSRDADGTASHDLLDAVTLKLTADDVRPLTDHVTVRSAEIIEYAVRARLRFFAGPDRSVALAEANRRTAIYTTEMHKLDMEVTLDGLYAAMRVPGVQKVDLEAPLSSIPVTKLQATFCTGIELIDAGVYEIA